MCKVSKHAIMGLTFCLLIITNRTRKTNQHKCFKVESRPTQFHPTTMQSTISLILLLFRVKSICFFYSQQKYIFTREHNICAKRQNKSKPIRFCWSRISCKEPIKGILNFSSLLQLKSHSISISNIFICRQYWTQCYKSYIAVIVTWMACKI